MPLVPRGGPARAEGGAEAGRTTILLAPLDRDRRSLGKRGHLHISPSVVRCVLFCGDGV